MEMDKKVNQTFAIFKLANNQNLYLSEPIKVYSFYKGYYIDELIGLKKRDGLSFLKKCLNRYDILKNESLPVVFNLTYDFGRIIEGQELEDDEFLGSMIIFSKAERITLSEKEKIKASFRITNKISKKDYKNKIEKVFFHLKRGDCYQVNLTHLFKHSYSEQITPMMLVKALFNDRSKVSPYAHIINMPYKKECIISNSPECLFQIKEDEIYTMPIKGTIKESKDAWKKLSSSKKDQAELYMITDLLRNDLTKINLNPSDTVFKKKKLKVPGLVHQYSLVKTKLSQQTSLLDIIKNVFPGGSITGAPKKRVMQIIDDIESQSRGVYCGSTILLHKSLKSASINIRTAKFELESQTFSYGSGGGITLLSETNSEYEEMLMKYKSFLLTIFNKC
jgi:anthranilate/para-aminobenzoate synthase component I